MELYLDQLPVGAEVDIMKYWGKFICSCDSVCCYSLFLSIVKVSISYMKTIMKTCRKCFIHKTKLKKSI